LGHRTALLRLVGRGGNSENPSPLKDVGKALIDQSLLVKRRGPEGQRECGWGRGVLTEKKRGLTERNVSEVDLALQGRAEDRDVQERERREPNYYDGTLIEKDEGNTSARHTLQT